MVAYDAETLIRHCLEILKGGAIIYDSSVIDTTIDEIPTLGEVKKRLLEFFKSKNMDQCFKYY
ncbi:MAG: hypothetical protein CM1200mP23_0560 [Nitrososphaerota archaeon]|nr:MAG: hypothetical protein CM1200mP23_0560 [Nitrososphaerota archaeon]